ncbi:MAG TPA: lipopolysaccharide biosynthesis protein [Bacteroidota bacterium]|nr:lipopolysaccharide biosynthesis protein [Bacteroidota bacterium]
MEIGRHLTKGIWGLADKSLPAIYGLGYVWLVIRVLPEEEFGNFVLVQEVFLVISGLATAFALQPLLKYAAEEDAGGEGTVSAAFLLNAAFTAAASLAVAALGVPAGHVLHAPGLTPLLLMVPAMLVASFFRNFTLTLLQARFMVREVFWTDAVHFLGAPLLVWIASRMHRFDSAMDMVNVNLLSLSASSLAGLWYARRMMRIRMRPPGIALRRVWDYGKYSLGGVVSSLFSTKADSFILSAFTGPVQVAVYNSAKVFVRVYETAAQVVQMFILPAASRLASRGNRDSLNALTEKAVLFVTLGLLPVTLLFLAFPGLLVNVLYGGRYAEAEPILRIFALLTFVVPLASIGSNVLMGLGEARLSFILGLEVLAASLAAFLLCIPPWGATGAGAGYALASLATAVLTVRYLVRFVPLTVAGVLRRTFDIREFLRKKFSTSETNG